MATISNTPRPGYVYDSTDAVWYPIGTGTHTHADYITSGSAINPTIVDAKGDIIAATAADTVSRLAVGANDTVLTADSSTATGLKWAAVAGGAGNMVQIATGSLSGASVTISSLSAYTDLMLFIYSFSNATADGQLRVRINNDSSGVYWYSATTLGRSTTSPGRVIDNALTAIEPGTGYNYERSATQNITSIKLTNCKNPGFTDYSTNTSYYGATYSSSIGNGVYPVSAAVSSLVISNSGGNFSGGTYYLWGA